MMRRTRMMAMLFALFTACIVLPSPLHVQAHAVIPDPVAAPAPVSIATDAKQQTQIAGQGASMCDDVPAAAGGALIGKIVPCVVNTIQKSTEIMTGQLVSWMMPVFFAFLLLTICFYGVRVVQNEPEIYKHGFLMALKIAIVATILTDLGAGTGSTLIPAGYGVMADAQKVVVEALNNGNLKCDVDKYMGAETPRVWATMDCVMGKLYGFTMGDGGKPSMVLVTSFAGLLTGFLFGGAWGIVVFFAMMMVLFSMFMLVVRTVVGFLIGYLMVCLMFILTPLFLPLTLMRGTDRYFQGYWRTILRGFLMPIIITAYSMVALMIYDSMLFADNSIVQKLFKYDMIKDALQPPKKACDRHITVNPIESRFDTQPSDAQLDNLFKIPWLQNIAFPTLSGGNDGCNLIKVPVFKPTKINGMKEGQDKEALTQMFLELLELFILAYLVAQGQAMLPSIITQLVGGGSVSTSLRILDESGSKYRGAYQSATQAAMKSFRNKPNDPKSGYKSGGTFARDLPDDLKNAAQASKQAYFNALKNK